MLKDFMTRRALARAGRALAPRMEPGEQLLAFDICRTDPQIDEVLNGGGARVDVVLSDRAVYVVNGGDAQAMNRIPFDDIHSCAFTRLPAPGDLEASLHYAVIGALARVFVVHLWDENSFAFMPHQRNGLSVVAPELSARIPDRTVATHRIALLPDGRGVTVTQSSGPPGSAGFDWNFTTDGGVDVEDENISGPFKRRMYQLMRDAGDPNADNHAVDGA